MSKLLNSDRTLSRSLTGRDSDSDDDYPSHRSSVGMQNVSRAPLLFLISCATLLVFWGWPFVVVPAGHSAVVDLFGYVQKDTIPAGFRLKQLFSNTYLFSLKTQLVEVTQDTPTSEGLMIELDVSILFHLEPTAVVKLYNEIGTNYNEILVNPEIESSIRGLTSKFTAKTLYSAGREELSQGINDELNEKLQSRGIIVEQVLLRKVVLPVSLSPPLAPRIACSPNASCKPF
ncbi:hypothetical protein CYMTET_32130 [Cymbomonas tetramitiformis]|uniref:Prohibitin n=1 Tax=Cymbomonas tetramitiformis TaxID=36881 RepID=A0AAE0KSJ1_9CHLO|nr:hypothetical protein CYMTET_32130 [Cymbomonas tetramitiformis]